MEYAISKKLWGVPIDAAKLNQDYGSYKELRLICPSCSQPVFLSKGATAHTRTLSSGKIIQVLESKDHFKHFSGDDDTQCLLKATKIKPKLTNNAAKTLNRDQRFKKLTDRFWIIYKSFSHPKAEEMSIEKMVEELEEVINLADLEIYLNMTVNWFKRIIPLYNEERIAKDILWVKSRQWQTEDANEYKNELIVPIQTFLAKEIFTFLDHKRNKQLIRKIIIIDLYIGYKMNLINWNLSFEQVWEEAVSRIVLNINTIKWLEAYEKLSNSSS